MNKKIIGRLILIIGFMFVILSLNTLAAKDFIVENKTSALFIINGTTGNVILTPSFGMVGIGTINPINALTIIGSLTSFGSLNATFINATEIRIGNNLIGTSGAFNNANYTTLEDAAFRISNFTAQLNNYIPSFFNNENFTNLKPFTLTNYSAEYALSGFKIINFTTAYDNRADRFGNANYSNLAPFTLANYSSEYSSSGFKLANFTTNYENQAYFKIANYTALENAAFTNTNASNLNTSLWNLSRNLILYPKDVAFLVRIGDVNRNISNDTFAVIGSAAVYGSLNATSFNSSFILQNGNQVQTINAVFNNVNYTSLENAAFTNTNYTNLEAAAFNKANYSSEYASTGFKNANYTALEDAAFRIANFTTNYEAQAYFKIANFTSNLNAQNGSLWNRSSTNVYLRFIDDLVGIGTITPDSRLTIRGTDADANLAGQPGLLHLNITDSYNKSTTNLITLDHNLNNPGNSTGGIGIGILFRAVNNDSELVNVSFINASLVNAINGSEASALSFYTRTANGLLAPKLILNGSDVFIGGNAATGGAITVLNSGNVGIGTTSPQNKLEVIGAATFAGGVNASSLNVTGFSITDDSLITLTDGSKKKIKDISAGEEVLTLDEKTGKLVPRKVNALLDHGIKPIYEMTTEDGRAINTTAEHPYFVKSSLLGIGDDLNLPPSFNSIKHPSKSLGSGLSLISLENDSNSASGLSCGIFSHTTENISSIEKLVKSSSLVTNTLFSDLENNANFPFESPFGLKATSYPSDSKNFNNAFFTFSSSRNLSCEGNADGDIIPTSGQISSIMQSCFDMLLCEKCYKTCDYLFNRHSGFKHLQDLPDHYPSSFKGGLSMANFTVRNNVFVDFNSHKINDDNAVYKTFEENLNKLGEWTEVRYLKVGDEIAVPDYSAGTIRWEKIASINILEPQHVFDLSIEGTRNFIANDIVAHNTYLSTASGSTGIGLTNPNYLLQVASGTDGRSVNLSNVLYVNGSSGNVGIGTTGPLATLAVNGTLVVNGVNVASGTSGASTVANILGVNTGLGFGGSNTVAYIESVNGNSAALRYDASLYQAWRTGAVLAERMRIDSSGNVGIGITSPASIPSGKTLHINGTLRASDPLNTQARLDFSANSSGQGYIVSYRDDAPQYTPLNVHFSVLSLRPNGRSTGFDIDNNGQIGINTTSPSDTLHVVGTSRLFGTSGTGLFVDKSSNVGIGTTSPTAKLHVSGDLNVTTQALFTTQNSTNNVGIGTMNPSEKFHVRKDVSNGDSNVFRGDNAAGGSGLTGETVSLNLVLGSGGGNTVGGAFIKAGKIGDMVAGGDRDSYLSFGTMNNDAHGERMRIDNVGNVGIGTTAPAYTLHVEGSIGRNSTDRLLIQGGNGGSNDYSQDTLLDLSASSINPNAPSHGGLARVAGINLSHVDEAGNAASGYISFSTSSGNNLAANWGERMRIDKSGNVGIGTTGPQSALSFATASHVGIATVDASDNGYLSLGGGGGAGDTRGAGLYMSGNERTTYGGQLAIFAGNAGASGFINFNTGGAEQVRITSTGNVGIGTTSPSGTLDVSGNVLINTSGVGGALNVRNGAGTSVLFVNGSSGNVGIGTTGPAGLLDLSKSNSANVQDVLFLSNSGNTAIGTGVNIRSQAKRADGNYDDLSFITSKWTNQGAGLRDSYFSVSTYAADAWAERLVIKTGNVGIGTTVPGTKLTVVGDVNVSGSLNVSSGLNVISGNVGIGTTGPTGLLTVNQPAGGLGSSAAVYVTGNTNSASAWPELSIVNTNTGTTSIASIYLAGKNASYAGRIFSSGFFARDLTFRMDTNNGIDFRDSSNNALVTLLSTGNVGIGTTVPGTKLTVAGDANISGSLNVSSGLNVISGNVGIGTTGPSAFLHVAGNFDTPSSGGLYLQSTAANSNSALKILTASGGSATSHQGIRIDHRGAGSSLFIENNGAARMIVDTNGNVGIGTTGPAALLHINGSTSPAVAISGTQTTEDKLLSILAPNMTDNNGVGVWLGKRGASDQSGTIFFYPQATVANSYLQFGLYGTSGPLVVGKSNVGIGTTTSGAKLDLRDGDFILTDADVAHGITTVLPTAAYASLEVRDATGGGLRIDSGSDADVDGTFMVNAVSGVAPTGANAVILLQGGKKSGTDGSALASTETLLKVANWGTPVMTILGNGNVGIGTTSPSRQLSLFTNTANTGGITFSGNQGDILLIGNDTDDNEYGIFQFVPSSGTGRFVFQAGTGAAPSAQANWDTGAKMVIQTNGNVGIGTTTPGEKLTVVHGSSIGINSSGTGSNFNANAQNVAGVFGNYRGERNGSIKYYLGLDTMDKFAVLNSDASVAMVVDTSGNTGNVGIGTTAPGNLVHILGTSVDNYALTTAAILRIAGSSTGALHFGSTVSSPFGQWIQSGATTNPATTYPLLLQPSGGNVGIGTTGPGAKLEIAAASAQTTGLKIGGIGDGQKALNITSSSTDGGVYVENTYTSYAGTLAELFVNRGDSSAYKLLVVNNTAGTKFLVRGDGNVGIGTTTPSEVLSVNGNVSIEGTNCRDSGGSATCNNFVDIAELFPSSEAVDSGDVLVADFNNEGSVKKSTKPYDKSKAGIVSTQPAIVIEGGRIVAMGGFKGQNNTLKPAVALAGRVPVKITDESGFIKAGDLITSSSKPGYAMKCGDELKCLNSVVGMAMENQKESNDLILVMVR